MEESKSEWTKAKSIELWQIEVEKNDSMMGLMGVDPWWRNQNVEVIVPIELMLTMRTRDYRLDNSSNMETNKQEKTAMTTTTTTMRMRMQ